MRVSESVRGVRVKGNVTISLNTGALLLSVVEGNLTVSSNNVLVGNTTHENGGPGGR